MVRRTVAFLVARGDVRGPQRGHVAPQMVDDEV
jgi:hypothetical protein